MWINHQTRKVSRLFYSHEVPLWPFKVILQTEMKVLLPFHIRQLVKSPPFHKPKGWKRYPFRAEPPRIGHNRKYPSSPPSPSSSFPSSFSPSSSSPSSSCPSSSSSRDLTHETWFRTAWCTVQPHSPTNNLSFLKERANKNILSNAFWLQIKILFNIYTIFIVMLQWIASVQKLAKPLKVVHSVTSSFSFHRLSFPISCLSFPSSSFSCCTVLAAFAPWFVATKIATENKTWYKLDGFTRWQFERWKFCPVLQVYLSSLSFVTINTAGAGCSKGE